MKICCTLPLPPKHTHTHTHPKKKKVMGLGYQLNYELLINYELCNQNAAPVAVVFWNLDIRFFCCYQHYWNYLMVNFPFQLWREKLVFVWISFAESYYLTKTWLYFWCCSCAINSCVKSLTCIYLRCVHAVLTLFLLVLMQCGILRLT